jgi:lipopolysaccharide/colanic/teichoic acid biosynthesis glycosyltransferase
MAYTVTKRALDVAVSLGLLVAFSWLFLIIAILVKLTSKGPVFYIQRRVGCGGHEFPFVKFRSMIDGADDLRESLEHRNEATGPVFKIRDDPRITWLGRILRKTSLDETPQLVNVLVGHMSLVGPRPPIPSEVAKYGERERRRLSVRPGLTCLWQINGRSNVTFDEWMEMDIQYIESRSLWLDIRILAKTIPAVLTGRGAC